VQNVFLRTKRLAAIHLLWTDGRTDRRQPYQRRLQHSYCESIIGPSLEKLWQI